MTLELEVVPAFGLGQRLNFLDVIRVVAHPGTQILVADDLVRDRALRQRRLLAGLLGLRVLPSPFRTTGPVWNDAAARRPAGAASGRSQRSRGVRQGGGARSCTVWPGASGHGTRAARNCGAVFSCLRCWRSWCHDLGGARRAGVEGTYPAACREARYGSESIVLAQRSGGVACDLVVVVRGVLTVPSATGGDRWMHTMDERMDGWIHPSVGASFRITIY